MLPYLDILPAGMLAQAAKPMPESLIIPSCKHCFRVSSRRAASNAPRQLRIAWGSWALSEAQSSSRTAPFEPGLCRESTRKGRVFCTQAATSHATWTHVQKSSSRWHLALRLKEAPEHSLQAFWIHREGGAPPAQTPSWAPSAQHSKTQMLFIYKQVCWGPCAVQQPSPCCRPHELALPENREAYSNSSASPLFPPRT